MTPTELRRAIEELDITPEELGELIGVSRRAVFYRISGEAPVKQAEAKVINMELAARRAARDPKRRENNAKD